ncbi:MAG TPA: hypothetical protein VLG27_02090 [Candidatus Saccharimonadia bacterium]|nr:hypothetical protein [Candidatus Saccharimonadia bacterium]
MLKRKFLPALVLSLLVGAAFLVLGPVQKANALAPSNYTSYLIDDQVFRDTTTMSAADIQNFLNSEGSALAGLSDVENCGSPSGAHYSYYATYYACGQRASAAQIIYAAGQAYGINPRVILATLQKEESLITDPSPSASQINFAMGYGCPDSGGCSFPGFFNQVDNGTWQFRTDMELGAGNNWWGYTPSSYPCNGATRYYSAALKAGNGVTFSDDNGVAYSGFVMPDMSTATLYCYTPHVYNNPQGQFGNPQFGTTGLYYSGSYNFVVSFVTWWGTTYTPSFKALFAGESGFPTIIRGNSSQSYLRYWNTGNKPWYDNISAPPLHTYAVHLSTSNPINAGNPFSAFWPAPNRPATTFTHVYQGDGTTLAPDQHTVQPGQMVEFDFPFSIPPGTSPSFYQNFFQPILEGSSLWNMSGVAWLGVTVQPVTFSATFAGEGGFPTLVQGQGTTSFLRYKNTGNEPWFDDVSGAQYHTYPVHLATSNPPNAPSPFSAGWPTNNRATGTFAHIYQADGVTLAPDQHIAQPGQIVEFDFPMTAAANMHPGSYQAFFQPVLEGSVFWNMGGTAWLGVNVQPITFQATFASQSAYPTIARGNSSAAFLKYKNTGNVPWFDDVSGATYHTYPVHLATSNPINSASPFSSSWPANNRAAGTFVHVYLADGTTLAADQHIAQPGQIVEFDFNFNVPSNLAPGTYQAFFQPVLEGSAFWNMGALSWLNVTVQ